MVVTAAVLLEVALPPEASTAAHLVAGNSKAFADTLHGRIGAIKRFDGEIGVAGFVVLVIKMVHGATRQPSASTGGQEIRHGQRWKLCHHVQATTASVLPPRIRRVRKPNRTLPMAATRLPSSSWNIFML